MNDSIDPKSMARICVDGMDAGAPIPGVQWGQLKEIPDHRGSFVKLYSKEHFSCLLPHKEIVETFATLSHARVLRGMHFQTPPRAYEKIVTCLQGSVLDVLLDLRVGSPTFRQHREFRLSSSEHDYLLIPEGIAHGFFVTQAPALMLYHQTAEHAPHLDTGISWNSFGFRWPEQNPIVSIRDSRFVSMEEFESPFSFHRTDETAA